VENSQGQEGITPLGVFHRSRAVPFILLLAACAPNRDEAVLVFAAASLKTALDATEPVCRESAGVTFRASYAATSALARQIEAGAPADLFISADLEWMDYAETHGLVRAGTRVNVAGNELVLVAPAGRRPDLWIAPGFALADALGDGRLAVADPATVPAGKYARAALESLGVWESVAGRLAPAENVRAALLLVGRGEAPLGIVYRSDAAAEPAVAIVGEFPADTHPPIVYPAALTRAAGDEAGRLLACLSSPAAQAVFARWGFDPAPVSR
jgi:molybdate transport system substrate-binding protein